jgi:hypothetical protein
MPKNQTPVSVKRTVNVSIPLKSDGTKDKRYSVEQFVKQDGTRDMRTSLINKK